MPLHGELEAVWVDHSLELHLGRLAAARRHGEDLLTCTLGVLSVQHAIGGAERNFATHDFIFSGRRQTLAAVTLQRYVRKKIRQPAAA